MKLWDKYLWQLLQTSLHNNKTIQLQDYLYYSTTKLQQQYSKMYERIHYKLKATTKVNIPLLFSQQYNLTVVNNNDHGMAIIQGWYVDQQQLCISNSSSSCLHISTIHKIWAFDNFDTIKRKTSGANSIWYKLQANFESAKVTAAFHDSAVISTKRCNGNL